jgi:hypothetical protein
MTRPHPRWLGVAAVAALVLAGCGDGSSGGEGAAASATSAPASTTTAPPVATTKAAVGVGSTYTVWFLRDGRLSPGEPRVAATTDGLREAVEALIAGRTEAEDALDLQTGLQRNVAVQSWEQQGDTLVVGFNRAFETAQTRPQVAQVVWTLTQFPGIERVQFLIDGRPNGATGVPPIDRADLDDIWAPVMVDRPLPSTLAGPGPLAVEGTAAPGAVVGWRVEDGFGTPLVQGGADEVAGAPGPDGRTAWRSTVTLPEGLVGVVRLVVFDTSTGAETFPQVVPVTVGTAPGP